ncbi:unnamed protein product, partial [Closterium sp. NIES-54]
VEARTLDELQEVLRCRGEGVGRVLRCRGEGVGRVTRVMLDNMVVLRRGGGDGGGAVHVDVTMLQQAVDLVKGQLETEASGNVTLETVGAIAATGVDFISSGALTHSVKALDISLNIDTELALDQQAVQARAATGGNRQHRHGQQRAATGSTGTGSNGGNGQHRHGQQQGATGSTGTGSNRQQGQAAVPSPRAAGRKGGGRRDEQGRRPRGAATSRGDAPGAAAPGAADAGAAAAGAAAPGAAAARAAAPGAAAAGAAAPGAAAAGAAPAGAAAAGAAAAGAAAPGGGEARRRREGPRRGPPGRQSRR